MSLLKLNCLSLPRVSSTTPGLHLCINIIWHLNLSFALSCDVFITLSKHQAKLKYVLKQIKADSLYNLIECISTDIGFAPLTLTICVFSWATLHVYWQRSGDGEVELYRLAARPRLQLYYDDGGQSVSVSCFNHRKNVKTSLSKYFPSISHI